MIEKLPYKGEQDSVRVGRVAGLATMILGETATVISAVETHSTEVFAAGSFATIGAALLAIIGVEKIFSHRETEE